tara:strand:+ start:835 stop:1353 length:519 start_codon:yes stop_codon:yes gene_type:complete
MNPNRCMVLGLLAVAAGCATTSPAASEAATETFHLHYGDATNLRRVLLQMLDANQPDDITIRADDANQTLTIACPPNDLDRIREMVTRIDIAANAAPHVVYLDNSLADDLEQTLRQILADEIQRPRSMITRPNGGLRRRRMPRITTEGNRVRIEGSNYEVEQLLKQLEQQRR